MCYLWILSLITIVEVKIFTSRGGKHFIIHILWPTFQGVVLHSLLLHIYSTDVITLPIQISDTKHFFLIFFIN